MFVSPLKGSGSAEWQLDQVAMSTPGMDSADLTKPSLLQQ